MHPLSCSVNIETIQSKPSEFELQATPEERAQIAKRLNLLSVEKLEAKLQLQKKEKLFLRGILEAEVIQECVRTLTPIKQILRIQVDEVFSFVSSDFSGAIELKAEDLSEPLQGANLDIGEVIVQVLSLNLDPYPIAPESAPLDYQEDNKGSSPFDVLKDKK